MNSTLKRIAKYTIYFSPKPIKKKLHAYVEKKQLEEGMKRMKRTKVDVREISNILDGIDFNHDIMLHTSIINIGKVKGGAKGITDAILNHCKLTDHTLLVSALPYFGQFAEYLKKMSVFDVRTAPIAMGVVNERIASLPEARRSVHPTHSVVAIGKDADDYTNTHHLDRTPFGPNSPYYKLAKRKGHVLMVGATINNLTLVHVVEDLLGDSGPVNPYSKKRYTIGCIDAEGIRHEVITPVHHPLKGIARDVSYLLDDGLKLGYIKRIPIGEAYIMDIDAHRVLERMIELMAEGKTLYGHKKPHRYPPLDSYFAEGQS